MQRVGAPPDRPLVLFDGDCGFCRRWVGRWKNETGESVKYEPFQSIDLKKLFPEISEEALRKRMHLIEPDGMVFTGAQSVFRTLSYGHAPASKRWRRLYEKLPGFSFISEIVYSIVAQNRYVASRITRWFGL